ncbi:MAG: hypothetical protein C4337_07650 [Armatimonadota bacterium]
MGTSEQTRYDSIQFASNPTLSYLRYLCSTTVRISTLLMTPAADILTTSLGHTTSSEGTLQNTWQTPPN